MSNILIFGLLFVVIIIVAVIIYKQKQKQQRKLKELQKREALNRVNWKAAAIGCVSTPPILVALLGREWDLRDYFANPLDWPISNGIGCLTGISAGAAVGAGINKFKR